LRRADSERAGRPEAQAVLAREVTRLVHGQQGLDAAQRITGALFRGDIGALGQNDLLQLRQDGLPATSLARDALPQTLTQLLSDADMAGSGKQVKDALGRGAVTVNGHALSLEDNPDVSGSFAPGRAMFGRFYLVRLGKKKYHLFEIA